MSLSTSSSKDLPGLRRKRRLVAVFFARALVFSPLVVLLAVTNYIVDPGSIFKSDDYLMGVASLLLQNKNVANLGDYNSRLLQKFYIEGLRRKNDIIVLGSSRSLQINSRLFPNATFFNNAVTSSTLQDYVAIFELYREKGFVPDTIVLGVDPWIFNKNNHIQTWKALDLYEYNFYSMAGARSKSPFFPAVDKIDRCVFGVYKYAQLFSISYFQASVNRLRSLALKGRQGKLSGPGYFATDRADLDVDIKLSDGSYLYEKSATTRSAEETLRFVKADFIEDNFSRQEFYSMDRELTAKFEVFVGYLVHNNIKLIFWLSPYHPYAYGHFVTHDEYSVLLDVEAYARKIALENNIPVIGSYDPKNCNLDDHEFYDSIHPKRGSVVKLFNDYLAGRDNIGARNAR